MLSQKLVKNYPNLRILVVVPTTTLKTQWESQLEDWNLTFNAEIQVINTIIKHNWKCDLLVLDECHRYNSTFFSKIFDNVMYKYILGLTATFERLDNKHVIMQQHCPVIDTISKEEAMINGWVSDYKEYQVLLKVDDIEEYKELNKKFIEHFEFFGFDFNKAKSCCGKDGWKYKLKLCEELYIGKDPLKRKEILGSISYHSTELMRVMQKRKAFINNHPKKVEITRKIMEARPDCKIITFSNNVKMAESIQNGDNVYTGKTSKKRSATMIEDFTTGKITQLNSCSKIDAGLDVPDVSVAIILGTDSSEIKAVQRRGLNNTFIFYFKFL